MLGWVHRRTAIAAVCGTGVLALAGAFLTADPRAAQQTQAAQPQPQQPPPPTFRLGASYVRVDVYPTRNGEPADDLEGADFELLEDGVPQKIEQFERISIQQTLDHSLRRDPNTVAESREQAADPRRRVFVIFLDTGMTTLEGSHAARRPIVELLDRLIGDDDLFAVMTPDMAASGITFAHRSDTIDAELSKYWTWGQRDALVKQDNEEIMLETCFPYPAPEKWCEGPGGKLVKQPSDAYRGVAAQLIERRNEQRALGALDELATFLGSVREERKAVIVISQGWRLLERKPQLTKLQECDEAPGIGQPGVGPDGRLVPNVGMARAGGAIMTKAQCQAKALEYSEIDSPSEFRQLVERANRFNVSFYPIDTRGLGTFDRSIGAPDTRIRNDPGEKAENLRGPRGPLAQDMDRAINRVGSLRTLAEATDGLAIVNTNDVTGGARRIVNDLSTYYLLGYQSTNTNLDGKWRTITVKVKTPGVKVRARKGYRALTEADLTMMRRGEAPTADPGAPTAGGGAGGPEAYARLVGSLAGLDRPLPWRSRVAWNGTASGGHTRLWIASDVGEATLRQPEWAGGGTLTATLVQLDGKRLGETTATLAPGARAIEATIDAAVPATAEVMVRLRLSPAGGGLPLSDTLRVTPAGTSARLFRRGPTTGRLFVAVGEPQFRRSEHVRVSLPIQDAAATVEATLLDRSGTAMRVPVATRVETIEGAAWAIGEAPLASLATGDYAIRMTVGSGGGATTTLTALRVVN
jgi:VWFA-related protein